MSRHTFTRSMIIALVASTAVSGIGGCSQMESAVSKLGVGGTTAAGAGGGALAGLGIGAAIGGKKGALIGALVGGVGGGFAGYFYAKNVKTKQSTEAQKREAEQRYREQMAKTPEPEREQLKTASTDQKKAVAVKLSDGTYQQIDPATSVATDTSYIVTPEDEKRIQEAQKNGQLVKVNDYDVLFDSST